jgi:hypothetical protein
MSVRDEYIRLWGDFRLSRELAGFTTRSRRLWLTGFVFHSCRSRKSSDRRQCLIATFAHGFDMFCFFCRITQGGANMAVRWVVLSSTTLLVQKVSSSSLADTIRTLFSTRCTNTSITRGNGWLVTPSNVTVLKSG